MIICEVTERFTLKDFDKLKNIQRKSIDTYGTLYVGDTFECDEKMVKYLSGDNAFKKPFVKVVEILPKEKPIKLELDDVKVIAEEVNKTTKKKKTSKK